VLHYGNGFQPRTRRVVYSGRKKAGWLNGQSALGPMCDAEKDWHERSFRASGDINGCQKSPLDESEINFSLFSLSHQLCIFKVFSMI